MTAGDVPLLGTDATPHALGGRLCLSFVNTLWWRRSPEPIEQLHGYPDVVAAVARAGWLDSRWALEDAARQHPGRATRAFHAAVELREHMAAAFSALAAGQPAQTRHLEQIEAVASSGLAALRLTPQAGPFALTWTKPTLDLPLQQVAVSAVLLLTSPDLSRTKQCQGPTCGWVFLDESRNRSRRWCDSRECGNRERVRAHYQRTHA